MYTHSWVQAHIYAFVWIADWCTWACWVLQITKYLWKCEMTALVTMSFEVVTFVVKTALMIHIEFCWLWILCHAELSRHNLVELIIFYYLAWGLCHSNPTKSSCLSEPWMIHYAIWDSCSDVEIPCFFFLKQNFYPLLWIAICRLM